MGASRPSIMGCVRSLSMIVRAQKVYIYKPTYNFGPDMKTQNLIGSHADTQICIVSHNMSCIFS